MGEDDRLEKLRTMMENKTRRGHRLCWIKWNPEADFQYDIEDAVEDIEWMTYEIRRLREENEEFRAFIDAVRGQMTSELDRHRLEGTETPPNPESESS